MNRKYRSWIPGIVFWVLFLAAIALVRHHRWVDTLWSALWMVFLLVAAAFSIVDLFRNRREIDGYVGYRGVPRWVVRLFGGGSD